MRTAIILAREHGKTGFTMVSGPEVPVHEQRELFKDYLRSETHPAIAEAQLWESDGGIAKKAKRITPAEKQSKIEAEARRIAEARAAKEKAEAEANAKKNPPAAAAAAATTPGTAVVPPAVPTSPLPAGEGQGEGESAPAETKPVISETKPAADGTNPPPAKPAKKK